MTFTTGFTYNYLLLQGQFFTIQRHDFSLYYVKKCFKYKVCIIIKSILYVVYKLVL
jgi:hypothetical protein